MRVSHKPPLLTFATKGPRSSRASYTSTAYIVYVLCIIFPVSVGHVVNIVLVLVLILVIVAFIIGNPFLVSVRFPIVAIFVIWHIRFFRYIRL